MKRKALASIASVISGSGTRCERCCGVGYGMRSRGSLGMPEGLNAHGLREGVCFWVKGFMSCLG